MFKFIAAIWKKNIGGKLSLIFGGLLFLAAGTLIPWAVITRHGDEGFLKAENGKELHWSATPTACFAAASVSDKALAVFDSVRQEYNQKIGKEIISPCQRWVIDDPLRPPIRGAVVIYVQVVPDDPTKPEDGTSRATGPDQSHPGGVAVPFFSDKKPEIVVAGAIFIDPKFAENRAVWLHEVGHILGLKHDRLRDSVMYPTIQERPGKLSGKDVKALKKYYK